MAQDLGHQGHEKEGSPGCPGIPRGREAHGGHDGPQNEGGGAVVQGHVARQGHPRSDSSAEEDVQGGEEASQQGEKIPPESCPAQGEIPPPYDDPSGKGEQQALLQPGGKRIPRQHGREQPRPQGDGVHDNHAARHGGVEEGGDPRGEVQGEEAPRENHRQEVLS